jgi:hypothetical protein
MIIPCMSMGQRLLSWHARGNNGWSAQPAHVADVARAVGSGGHIRIELKTKLSCSMLKTEEAILAALNEAGCVTTREALKRFDTAGSPRLNALCVGLTGLGLGPNSLAGINSGERSINIDPSSLHKYHINRTYAAILSRSKAGNGVWGFLRMRWRLN